MNRKDILTGIAITLLTVTSAVGLLGWRNSLKDNRELTSRIAELERQEKRSTVLRSVSQQMEEIAHQQSAISERQREEALQQTRIANEMRERAEIEQANAMASEQKATASEKKALEASAIAEHQREIAEHQRIQAEMSKHVADTLSYIALGRSLGSISTIQYQAGNQELADMLAYAAYTYTSRYKGDLYMPAIFRSLSLMSHSTASQSIHKGALTDLVFMPGKKNDLISVDNYGGIRQTHIAGGKMNSTYLFQDSKYDFRSVYADKKTSAIYAVSRTGHLVITGTRERIVDVSNMAPLLGVTEMTEGRTLLLVGTNKLALFDIDKGYVVKTVDTPYRITCFSRGKGCPLLFDDKAKMHYVKSLDNIETTQLPVKGTITAYSSSNTTGYSAYGMSDGTIYLRDPQGHMNKLVGHRSRISKLKFNEYSLFSSSYDGSINLWIVNRDKVEPMSLVSSNLWIMTFTFEPDKNYLLMGDLNGRLTSTLISIPMMVDNIRQNIKRDFTADEWNYYIGKNVPFEPLLHHATNKKPGQ